MLFFFFLVEFFNGRLKGKLDYTFIVHSPVPEIRLSRSWNSLCSTSLSHHKMQLHKRKIAVFFQANKVARNMPSMTRLWSLNPGDKKLLFSILSYVLLFARKISGLYVNNSRR